MLGTGLFSNQNSLSHEKNVNSFFSTQNEVGLWVLWLTTIWCLGHLISRNSWDFFYLYNIYIREILYILTMGKILNFKFKNLKIQTLFVFLSNCVNLWPYIFLLKSRGWSSWSPKLFLVLIFSFFSFAFCVHASVRCTLV